MPDGPRVRIAVSGHRQLADPERFQAAIRITAELIRDAFPGCRYQVLSCLAEGADRLLVEGLLPLLDAELVVVLPMAEVEYLKDFRTEGSRNEFLSMRAQAVEVIEPSWDANRPQAYREANRVLVASTDLVVAIWNGQPARGPGGTAEVVELARLEQRPLIWIQPNRNVSLGQERLPPAFGESNKRLPGK